MIVETIRKVVETLRTVEPNTKFSPGDPFTELAKLPAVVIEGPQLIEVGTFDATKHWLFARDLDTKTFIKERGPKFFNVDFQVSVSSKKETELLALVKKLTMLPVAVPLLSVIKESRTEQYAWGWQQQFRGSGAANLCNVHEATAVLRVQMVAMLTDIQMTGKLIETFVFEYEQE